MLAWVGLIDGFKCGMMKREGERDYGQSVHAFQTFRPAGERMRGLHWEPGSFEA
jgi:hypothetical protein